ncbi:PP2C family serine/threonine-protein phosphatase [Salinibacterium sp. SWN1162]|uniref:PP2C family protein-serine/threonine phosphatase n=1 Tax=Salinibacterium sp. SWN1162 TaxID=2792053 RepID=UPI0018CD300D|nr:protein phosphatase 2C domain-containing protein [Salinibacterium sp. SWN1162]MBH0008855.1 serine/threonine-protein phosphatase [Salinibacterium sp. SWN1162]
MVSEHYDIALPQGVMRMTVSAASDCGPHRTINEDSFLVLPGLFVVADGMGGHSFGDRASQCVVQSIARSVGHLQTRTPEHIVQAIAEANDAVMALNAPNESVSGTTLSGIALVTVGADPEPRWMAFNVGDSRVYSWNGRQLEQITVDHSAVQELIELGHITALEATSHPDRNIITRALGIHSAVNPDFWLLPAGAQHTFVACSDGLTKELDDDLIAGILADRAAVSEGETLANRLVAGAIAAGGSDNVTVVVIEASRIGLAHTADEDTAERDFSHYLEQTRPRK